ncbi:unnamed protein product, partial [Polarella glacialis]
MASPSEHSSSSQHQGCKTSTIATESCTPTLLGASSPGVRVKQAGKSSTGELRHLLALAQPSWSPDAGRSPARARRRAYTRTLIVLVLTVLLCAWPWIGYGSEVHTVCEADKDPLTSTWACVQRYIFFAYSVGLCFLAALVTVSQLRWWHTSRYLVAVRLYVVMTWLVICIFSLRSLISWCYSSHLGSLNLKLLTEEGLKMSTRTWRYVPGASQDFYMISGVIMVNLFWLVWGWGVHFVRRHLSKLEDAFQKPLGATALKWALYWDVFALLAALICGVMLLVCGWYAPTLAYVFYGIAISV